jgi:hypothetical protein
MPVTRTDLEHPVAGLAAEHLEQRLAPGLQHRSEDCVVETGIAAVRRLYRFNMHSIY